MLTDPEKAVLFLLSLDEETARPIIDELSEEEIKKLRDVAGEMREVSTDAVDHTFREFIDRTTKAVAVPRGGLRYLRRLSAGALGEERARVVFEGTPTSPIAKLEAAPAEDVASLLSSEPPQLAAAVLSMMSARAAAEILAAMGDEQKGRLVKHVSLMKKLPQSVLEDVAAALAAALPDDSAASVVALDGVAKAAEMLNASGKSASLAILATIEAEDGELAAAVRTAMFTFDDLGRLDARAMRNLLRELATDKLTIALKGASPDLLAAVFRGLSSRAAELIRDDLETMSNIRKADVEQARKEIIEIALRLESEGKISLGREDD